jgi:hypothetical protein
MFGKVNALANDKKQGHIRARYPHKTPLTAIYALQTEW